MAVWKKGQAELGITPEQFERGQRAMARDRAVREARKHQAREEVTLEMELHPGCGVDGRIVYQSSFCWVSPPFTMDTRIGPGGSRGHDEERIIVWCNGCGSAIAHPDWLKRYAERVKVYRNREPELPTELRDVD